MGGTRGKQLSMMNYLLVMMLILELHSCDGFVGIGSTLAHRVSKLNAKTESQTLGLLTFDLDDTLYPIGPVEQDANDAFVKAMGTYGFKGLERDDIVRAAKQIREEIGKEDPAAAAILTHTEVRELAIRQKMEEITMIEKLQACADDWATPVESLSALVVQNAKKWSKAAISDSMVKAVSTAWEMERHHSAERHLYPEVLEVLQQIKDDHPKAIIGAVTDGRSNPTLMQFTLGKYFDFACSWQDDQGQRKEFFQELESTGGDSSQLTWIYDEARYKYAVLKQAAAGMEEGNQDDVPTLVFPDTYDDRVWIHVGDDLALDVGGSAACGAKTIYAALADKYEQTARYRHEGNKPEPAWSTTPPEEMKMRQQMALAGQEKVDVELNFLTRLPEAVNDILAGR